MPNADPSLEALLHQRDVLRNQIASIGDLRPGSLSSRFRPCGKSNCRCAREGDPGHGPTWYLQRLIGKKVRSHTIPAHALGDTRRQLAECQRFRALTREFMEVSDRICHLRLRTDRRAPTAGAPKKGASRRSSPPRSPRKPSG